MASRHTLGHKIERDPFQVELCVDNGKTSTS